ncbi:alpha/beta fold hydrolase [uncultured Fusobacterium sp.]|jgi:alpha-beta hydrolase superfamily lysophospholipase|uniref:alpha/beta fold hydrolase n=1 Tax=uncultured Fusobacterium sp. TaxID=159267 RepID=UPI0015A4FE1A|nr:alpha/beta fold hydrolase [uncultured Fusobacterium sp.]
MKHIKGIIQIIHGMSEHKDRYKHLFKYFSNRGYLVTIKEHLHHGHNNTSQEKIGIFENDFQQLIIDQVNYTKELKEIYPNTPIYIFGHSMGSFIAQEHMKQCYNIVNGYILCGSCYKTPFLWKLAEYLSFFMNKIYKNKRAYFIKKLVFLNSNSKVKSKYYYNENSWLSRDIEEVKNYSNDELCDFTYSSSFYSDFFYFLNRLYISVSFKNIDRKLPIYIISGDMDPVGRYGKGVIQLNNFYKKLNFTNVQCKLYSNARHELHNEINRDEVFFNIDKWLNN